MYVHVYEHEHGPVHIQETGEGIPEDGIIMKSKARLAFIGLGTMGRDLLRETLKNPKAEITALCDVDPHSLRQAVGMCGDTPAQYTDYHDLLAEGQLDGVVVAVPQHLHAQISIDALSAGITTFCEKPMALNVRECDAMLAAAARNGRGLMIGQVLQYVNVYRYILERIRSGEFGKPLAMRTIRTMGRWGSWMRPWRQTAACSGGMLLEVNVHEIDLILRVMGAATSVSAIGKHFSNDEIDYEDFVSANLTFANGGLGSMTSVQWDLLGKNNAEIYLEKGTIYYDSYSQTAHITKGDGEREVHHYADIHPEWENGLYREMREFADACLGEGPITIPGEDGMRAVEVAEACYVSLREGRTVTLPLPR